MKKYISVAALAISLLLFGVLTEAKATVTALALDGKGWISQDVFHQIDASTGFTIVTSTFTDTRNKFAVTFDSPTSSFPWSAKFRAPTGEDLGVGHYENLVGYTATPLTSFGAAVSGGGHGNATYGGYVNILEIVFSGNNVISFAADGYQTTADDGVTSGPLNEYERYSVRFNSNIPLTPLSEITTWSSDINAIPEPSMLALPLPFVGMFTWRRRR